MLLPRAAVCLLAATAAARADYPWQNASLPVAQRVLNLVSLLTLEEKAALLSFHSPALPRLGLPAFGFEAECQRGVRFPAAPVAPFPSGAAQTAAFNASLVFAIGRATATQARASFNVLRAQNVSTAGTTCYGPTMNLVRDPRWGRVNEMLGGEDPALTGALAAAFARGLQSFRAPSPAPGEEPLMMIATVAKHLAVYSGPEGDYDDTSDEMPGHGEPAASDGRGARRLGRAGLRHFRCRRRRLYGHVPPVDEGWHARPQLCLECLRRGRARARRGR